MTKHNRAAADPAIARPEVTPEMIAAGALILWELEGETSKEALAREVYLAMAQVAATPSD